MARDLIQFEFEDYREVEPNLIESYQVTGEPAEINKLCVLVEENDEWLEFISNVESEYGTIDIAYYPDTEIVSICSAEITVAFRPVVVQSVLKWMTDHATVTIQKVPTNARG